jgi:hypothetical protein
MASPLTEGGNLPIDRPLDGWDYPHRLVGTILPKRLGALLPT